jgi:biopolymer transport protein ExbD
MGARFDSGDDLTETHEINVTPFIDVMLVLLIIFMIAAPLSTVDVAVDLPASNAGAKPPDARPITLTLKADRSLKIGDDAVTREGLAAALDQASNADRGRRLFVRADKRVSYDDLMSLMNDLRSAGYLQIGLVGLAADSAP